jgi:hypothetical protein
MMMSYLIHAMILFLWGEGYRCHDVAILGMLPRKLNHFFDLFPGFMIVYNGFHQVIQGLYTLYVKVSTA